MIWANVIIETKFSVSFEVSFMLP